MEIKEFKYRRVRSMYGRLNKNVTGHERSHDLADGELGKDLLTMSDGLVIEICFWHDSDIFLEDISVDKEKFDALYDIPFEQYMINNGLYAENIEEPNGNLWQYCGPIHVIQPVYRLQYYLID